MEIRILVHTPSVTTADVQRKNPELMQCWVRVIHSNFVYEWYCARSVEGQPDHDFYQQSVFIERVEPEGGILNQHQISVPRHSLPTRLTKHLHLPPRNGL